jgi:hypothetical protein
MKCLIVILLLCVLSNMYGQPISQYLANPHYFSYRNKPLLLISSGEHYGAVINIDFDYRKYLATLKRSGLNLTRLFIGTYVENADAFGIVNNTLAPARNRLLCPWARSNTPGYINGGSKFDLNSWDETYFTRLKDFMKTAAENEVVVECTFFSSFYWDGQYAMSPLHFKNNITLTDSVPYKDLQAGRHPAYFPYQQALVRKLVTELNDFDNLYYEIQNEPWADHPDSMKVTTDYYTAADLKDAGQVWKRKVEIAGPQSLQWQVMIADIITATEKPLPKKHLISQDVANFGISCTRVYAKAQVLNFHYALPEAITDNYHWNKIIAFNETGFSLQDPEVYRRQAWRFILSGGAAFNHLDYSFVVGGEEGTNGAFPPHSSGGPVIRKGLSILVQFMKRLDLAKLQPDRQFVVAAPGTNFYSMKTSDERQFTVYLENGKEGELRLLLPKGKYKEEWMNAKTGLLLQINEWMHQGG